MIRIAGTRRIIRSATSGINGSSVRYNHYMLEKLKSLNELGKKIADEKSDESKKVIKNIRRIGLGSMLVVVASIFLASSRNDDGMENVNFDELKLDDFKKN